jgi:alkylation response protein AidB-like acyl-CoA dehydrogenase
VPIPPVTQAPAVPAAPVTGADEAGARRRIADLENRFGPLAQEAAPFGHPVLLEADARAEVSTEAEGLLDDYAFNAEFVPAALGGRLRRMDVLGRILRPVCRRDISLGFGYGLNVYFATTPVWAAGDPAQRKWTAELLLNGERVALGRPTIAHSNDFVRDEFTAAAGERGGYLVDGAKTAICNSRRARGMLLIARLDPGLAGSHSILLIDREGLPAGAGLRDLKRYETMGLRGCEFGGLEFANCPVPADALVGEEGRGMQLAVLCSIQTRCLLPSVMLASADTLLRTAVQFAVEYRGAGPYAPLRVPYAREVMAGGFTDQLIGDSITLAATRGVHLLPDRMSAYAAAASYVVPRLLQDAARDLSTVLGQFHFSSRGRFGMFGKQLRDLPLIAQGHSGTAARQAMIIPQLAAFARNSWFQDGEPPATLFRPAEDLPELDPSAIAVTGLGDPLAATLIGCHELITGEGDLGGHPEVAPVLRQISDAFVEELAELRKECAEIPGDLRLALSSARMCALADRYALVLAAAACLGVWREQRQTAPGSFLADPAWLTAALHRLGGQLGLRLPECPDDCQQRILDELLERHYAARSFDLYDAALAG